MMMFGVPMVPMLGSNTSEQSTSAGTSGSALVFMTMAPVIQACQAAPHGQCVAFPSEYRQLPHLLWQQQQFQLLLQQQQQQNPNQVLLEQRSYSAPEKAPPHIAEARLPSALANTQGGAVDLATARDVLSNLFCVLTQKDPEMVRTTLQTVLAPDVVLSWPDMATEVSGRDKVVEHAILTLQNVPDIEYLCEDIVMEGEFSFRVSQLVRGTAARSDPSSPFFRAGKVVSKRVSSLITFDEHGLIKERATSLFLPPTPSIEPSILNAILDNALALSNTSSGSRILSHAVEKGDTLSLSILAEHFRSRVLEASFSPHTNHVLQKLVVRMPPERVQFIAAEMQGRAVEVARNRTQSRVLERLIEHCPPSYMECLIEEVIASASTLCRHDYGNFIVQSILEHGTEHQRARLAVVVLDDVHRLAKHKFGSNVVRTALVHSPHEQKDVLIDALASDPRAFAHLSKHRIGSFVAREVKTARSQMLGQCFR